MDKALFRIYCSDYVGLHGTGDQSEKAKDLTNIIGLGDTVEHMEFVDEQTTAVAETICASYYFGKKNA